MSTINILNIIMSKDRLKEIEGDQITGITEIAYSDKNDDHYGVYHGDTVSKMLIVILLILMAIICTFMAIIMRNLRVSKLLLHLYMRTFNHMTE